MHIPQQIFSWLDIPVILILLILEILLSADNASVIAMLVRKLPHKQHKTALFAGLISGFVFRGIAVLLASYLIDLFWMQIIGGLYLLYLAVIHIIGKKKPTAVATKKTSIFKIIFLVELADLLFAVDSILAAFALVVLYYPLPMVTHKLWVIYLGGILGIITMRIAASKLIAILDCVPKLEKIIFFLVGWMGVKLIVEGFDVLFHVSEYIKGFVDLFFWIGTVLIMIFGLISVLLRKKAK